MHSAPRKPTRGNWIWAAAGVLAITVLTGAALHFAGSGCRAPTAGAAPRRQDPARAGGATDRSAVAAALPPALPPVRLDASRGPAVAGLAVYYNPGTAVGSCLLGPFHAGGEYVSLPPQLYAGGAACGSYLDVHGPGGSVLAEVVDLCPGCAATTINLSRAAFGRIASLRAGSAPVSFQQANDPVLAGPIELRVGAATAPRVLSLQVLRHGNPLTSVAVAASGAGGRPGRWHQLILNTDSFWVSRNAPASTTVSLRVTDNRGHRVVLSHLRLRPGRTVYTTVWMYRDSAPPSPLPTAQPSPLPGQKASPQRTAGPAGPLPRSARPLPATSSPAC